MNQTATGLIYEITPVADCNAGTSSSGNDSAGNRRATAWATVEPMRARARVCEPVIV